MSEIGQDRWVGFLGNTHLVKRFCDHITDPPYFVQSVGESIICSWRCAEDFPVVHHQFVTTGGSFPLRDRLKCPSKLYRRLEREGQSLVCLCLKCI